jgi:hypothetical protein
VAAAARDGSSPREGPSFGCEAWPSSEREGIRSGGAVRGRDLRWGIASICKQTGRPCHVQRVLAPCSRPSNRPEARVPLPRMQYQYHKWDTQINQWDSYPSIGLDESHSHSSRIDSKFLALSLGTLFSRLPLLPFFPFWVINYGAQSISSINKARTTSYLSWPVSHSVLHRIQRF